MQIRNHRTRDILVVTLWVAHILTLFGLIVYADVKTTIYGGLLLGMSANTLKKVRNYEEN